MAQKILIIDDEELVNKSLSKLLKKEGYDGIVAKSGQDAIEKVKETDFDLIISDIRMPQMDGIETVMNIRAYLDRENKKRIPEILITGYSDEEKYKNAVNLKVSAYIYKPFDIKTLTDTVRRILNAAEK